MATDQHFADFVRDQMSGAGDVSSRKMFGEYAIYLDGKVVALVCDNQCFVKRTDEGREFLGQVTEGPPFPGANPYFVIADELDDRERLAELVRITARALPAPKPKKSATKMTKAVKTAKTTKTAKKSNKRAATPAPARKKPK